MANQFFPDFSLFAQVLPQPLPMQKVQQHWLDGMNNLVNLELEAMMEYNHLWFDLWQDCATSDPSECHQHFIDHWEDHHKLLINHQKRREAAMNEWKEHIEEVL